MAGLIKEDDVEEVKRRANIADLVSQYVALKPAGIDSLKGLCPFHDERSPSFHVRPSAGYYHCFGCGVSGDAITFLREIDHLTFQEAVERLAGFCGYTLRYEKTGETRSEKTGEPARSRLFQANAAASQFFQNQLANESGNFAVETLAARGFTGEALTRFGVGFAPRGWDTLTRHLLGAGYTSNELVASGLASKNSRGCFDRFRGRIIWPIRDTSGQTIGFGARKLFDDDTGPKYLNTPETPIYHKQQVLYGLDLAKKAISRGRRAVIVEGYTDVMACHLAGVPEAVATCGTAFGSEHIRVLRRVMGDDRAAQIIFTFDPDEAGQKAALRAFSEEEQFNAQTYAASGPEGKDPADLRQEHGDTAVRELFERKQPLFAFALSQAVARFPLDTIEGRAAALREAAPIVAGIRDKTVRSEYVGVMGRMIGLDMAAAQAAVRAAARHPKPGMPRQKPSIVKTRNASVPGGGANTVSKQNAGGNRANTSETRPGNTARTSDTQTVHTGSTASAGSINSAINTETLPVSSTSNATKPVEPSLTQIMRNNENSLDVAMLSAALQHPLLAPENLLSKALQANMVDPRLATIRQAMAETLQAGQTAAWPAPILEKVPSELRRLVSELAMTPLPHRGGEKLRNYVTSVLATVLRRELRTMQSELIAEAERTSFTNPQQSKELNTRVTAMEKLIRHLDDSLQQSTENR